MVLSYVLLRKVPVRRHRSDMFGTREAATLNDDCITFFPPSMNSLVEHLDTKNKESGEVTQQRSRLRN